MTPLTHPLFVKFIIYFNDNQDFFECHEVLEDYWNSFPVRTKEHPLIGYILLATGMYHWRRGNTTGALRTLKKAQRRMATMQKTTPAFTEGIDFNHLVRKTDETLQFIKNHKPFRPFLIKIQSTEIQQHIEQIIPTLELLPPESDAIIHKHLLRDRTEVIKLRDEKKKGR